MNRFQKWFCGREFVWLQARNELLEKQNADLRALTNMTPEYAELLINSLAGLSEQAITGKSLGWRIHLAMASGPSGVRSTLFKLCRAVWQDVLEGRKP